MKIETNLIFDDRDLELLSKPIPLNPCGYCFMGSGCVGCSEHFKYLDVTEEYQERGILKYAEDLKNVSTYREQIEKIQDKIDDILDELPEQVKKICDEQTMNTKTEKEDLIEELNRINKLLEEAKEGEQ